MKMAIVPWLFGLSLIYLCKDVASKDTCCPDTWLPYRGSCYLFHDEEKVDWNEAQQFCKNRHESSSGDNVYLVTVETQNENLFLKGFARKLYNPDSHHRNNTMFWLGASDGDIEGIWKWVDKDEELTFTDWDQSHSQPNVNPDNHEDCLALNGAYDFSWHDGICRERLGYPICEKKGSSSDGGVGMQIIG